MTTPTIMLVLLVTPCLVARILLATGRARFDPRAAASVGAGLLFVFTGLGHFIETEPMAQMLPGWVPQRVLLVYLAGILELALAAGFFLPRTRRFAGWAAAALLVSFFPVNIYAALHQVPMGGHAWGPVYLLIRAPVQAFTLFWVYWFTIRRAEKPVRAASLPS